MVLSFIGRNGLAPFHSFSHGNQYTIYLYFGSRFKALVQARFKALVQDFRKNQERDISLNADILFPNCDSDSIWGWMDYFFASLNLFSSRLGPEWEQRYLNIDLYGRDLLFC